MTTLNEQAKQLLPPNQTQLEVDFIESCLAQFEKLKDSNTLIKTIKGLNSPDNVIPWLIYEYRLGKIATYIEDEKTLIEEGLAWKRELGTLAAVKRALNWIFREDELLEDHDTKWWHYTNNEIRLVKEIPDLEVITKIVKLVKLSLPKRSTLARVWSGTDLDMFTLNTSLLNENRLNVPGGIYDEDLDVWLYINNKVDVSVSIGLPSITVGEEIEEFVIVKRYPELNDAGFLNSITNGPLISITVPEFSTDHVTIDMLGSTLSTMIRLDNPNNFNEIKSPVVFTTDEPNS